MKLWLLVLVFAILAIAGFLSGRKALNKIHEEKHVADSIADYWHSRYDLQVETSRKRDTVLTQHADTSTREGKAADKVHSAIQTIHPASLSVRDSLNYRVIRDSLQNLEIVHLRAKSRSDSLRIVILTADRNDWHRTADSLHMAMLKENTSVGKVAAIASSKISLGLFSVPKEIVYIGLAAGAGYTAAKATD